MQLIRDLDNPAKYVRKDRVAVFKPHRRRFPDGREVVVTEADLREIAANVNRAYGQDGELVRLTLGHRKQGPDVRETDQPPVVGYARDYRAELVQRPGGPVLRLTHTEYIRADRSDVLAGQYPGRSPEYDPEGKTITGVALLTRDQYLALGTVAYQAEGAVSDDDGDEPDVHERAAEVVAKIRGIVNRIEAEGEDSPRLFDQVDGLLADLEGSYSTRLDGGPNVPHPPAWEGIPLVQRVALWRARLSAVEAAIGREARADALDLAYQAPADHQRVMDYMRSNLGTQYHQAQARVRYGP